MNFNIALNTIIYIMVFLFPGFLFRRAFFSGKLDKQFDSGSSVERFLWNLLFSILCITLFSFIIYFFRKFNFLAIDSISPLPTSKFIEAFTNLHENKYPEILKEESYLYSAFTTLSSIYILSAITGYFLKKIIFIFSLEKRFSILKFQSTWDYLTASNKKNNSTHNTGDVHYTKVDIKTKTDELFTGKLHQILYENDGKIDAIAIQNCYKFYRVQKTDADYASFERTLKQNNDDPHLIFHSEGNSGLSYRKRIKGDVFTIFNSEIENISITFVKVSDINHIYQRFLKIFISLLLLLVTLTALINGIWDINLYPFESPYKRIGFSIVTPFSFTFLILLLIDLFSLKKYKNPTHLEEVKDSFLITVLSLVPYLYIFGFIGFNFLIPIFAFSFIIISSLLKKQKKSQSKDEQKVEDE